MLENVPLFSGLSKAALAEVEQHGSIKTYRKNTIIMNQGDATDSLYVILSGSVKVFISGDDGREAVLNHQGKGEYFGDLALIDKQPRVASVINPEIALNLIRPMTSRIRMLAQNVSSLALLDVYGRVARTLLQMATEQPGGDMVTDKVTQQDIADMVGASRAMVSRILTDLKTGGYISIDKKRITIQQRLPTHW
jgi:CRP/FNR family cyclic AMP-dependent transcriptional regulator